MIRHILGVRGKGNHRKIADKSLFRAPRPAGWTGVIPEPMEQQEWKAVEITGEHRTLILSDVHIPFHDVEALTTALEYGRDREPTLILLNGDIADHYAISRWQTDPRKRNFAQEVRDVRQFLQGLRKHFKNARIIYKLGNHEERFEKFLQFKAPELLGLPQFEWSEVFGLKDYGIELVDGKRPIRLGELNILHGHEYVFQISNPVNPARGLYLRAKRHSLCGHFHQASQHSEKDIEQSVVSTWSTGCLCDLHPDYRPLNPWNHGFAYVETDASGAFKVSNMRIIDGKAW